MKPINEDFYLTILRFGKEKLGAGCTIQEVSDFLTSKGFKNTTPNSIFLYQYFSRIFFSKGVNPDSDIHHSEWYYLRPECYMQLLEYENMSEARKEAKRATTIAIIAIILTLGSIVISIFK